MTAKTMHVDDDVLEVIRDQMEWAEDGLSATITTTLDRKLYIRVNKVLEELGGRWDTRKGCHSFKSDPRPRVEGLLDTETLTVEKDGFFETPPKVAYAMIGTAGGVLSGTILEPSAGMGAIANVVLENLNGAKYATLYMVEKNPERAEHLRKTFKHTSNVSAFVIETDFLDISLPGMFDFVLMNPPFEKGQDIDHVMHAYEFLKPGGVLVAVMSEGVFFRSDKKAVNFRVWLEKASGDTYQLPEKSFHSSGTDIQARLVKIVHG